MAEAEPKAAKDLMENPCKKQEDCPVSVLAERAILIKESSFPLFMNMQLQRKSFASLVEMSNNNNKEDMKGDDSRAKRG